MRCKFCYKDEVHAICKLPPTFRVKVLAHAVSKMAELPRRCVRTQDVKRLNGLIHLNRLMQHASDSDLQAAA